MNKNTNKLDIEKRDWKLFLKKLPYWQENYMNKLNKEYIKLLLENKKASTLFWELDKKIKEDKKSYGVIIRGVSKSEFDYYICGMLNDEVITMDDLTDFSEEFKNRISFLRKI